MEENEVYYQTVDFVCKNIENLLTADMARELTNKTLVEKIRKTLLDVEKVAKEGKHTYCLVISNKYDFDFIKTFFQSKLGYKITKIERTKDSTEMTINW